MPTRRTFISLPEEEYQDAKDFADKDDRTFSGLARIAIREYIARHSKTRK